MLKQLLYVRKEFLLIIAGLVWIAAGVSVARTGLPLLLGGGHASILGVLLAALVFWLFIRFIFSKLVYKHSQRIGALPSKAPIHQFFDRKGYLTMVFMISGGILLRSSGLLPAAWIGILYSGIGTALGLAGLLFLGQYGHTRLVPAQVRR